MSFAIQPDGVSIDDMNLQSGLSSSLLLPARIDPLTKTANFSVNEAFDVYTCGAAPAPAPGISVTLPSASLYPGRVLHFKNVTAQTLVSDLAASVIPGDGTAPGTAILAAAAGNSSTLVSNGTVWINVRRSVV